MKTEHLGLGVLIGLLGGNKESVEAFQSCIGKEILDLKLEGNSLNFVFKDGTRMSLFDDGQSCCENRYMQTDDKLSEFIGANLLGAEVKEAPGLRCEYGEHEVAFLDVKTSKGVFQMSTHNEHNGYYGGFLIRAQLGK